MTRWEERAAKVNYLIFCSKKEIVMTSLDTQTEQQAENYLSEWISNRQFDEFTDRLNLHHQLGPYVAISREAGVGGSQIAQLVGEKLNWEVIDKQIVDFMAEKYDVSKMVVENLDEKNSALVGEFFSSLILDRDFSQPAYLHQLNRLVLLAAIHGNVVLVGRGAGFILPREKGLSVRLIATEESRIEKFARRKNVSVQEAKKQVHRIDTQRKEFVRKNYAADCSDPLQYDLTINVTDRTDEQSATIIADAVNCLFEVSR